MSNFQDVQNLVTKRISVSIPDATRDKLQIWADNEGTSVSDLVSYLVRKAVDQAEVEGKLKPK